MRNGRFTSKPEKLRPAQIHLLTPRRSCWLLTERTMFSSRFICSDLRSSLHPCYPWVELKQIFQSCFILKSLVAVYATQYESECLCVECRHGALLCFKYTQIKGMPVVQVTTVLSRCWRSSFVAEKGKKKKSREISSRITMRNKKISWRPLGNND